MLTKLPYEHSWSRNKAAMDQLSGQRAQDSLKEALLERPAAFAGTKAIWSTSISAKVAVCFSTADLGTKRRQQRQLEWCRFPKQRGDPASPRHCLLPRES